MKKISCYVLLFVFSASLAAAQSVTPQTEQVDIESLKEKAPKVFIDCGWCDIEYIKTEITFVNYVRERKEAQIHILVTTLRTGGGGKEYTISFIGQGEFDGIDDTHKYFSKQTDTEDEIREGLVKALKVGLMSYVAKTPIASRINISYSPERKALDMKDKWDFWVFSLSSRGRLSGEKSYKSHSFSGSLSANRITEELKINLSLSGSFYKDEFIYEEETIESTSDSMSFYGLCVKSISDHWSVGGYFTADSSTFENIKFSFNPAAAVEYNFYPYSESTRRQFRLLYKIGYNLVRYREETIFDKISEDLWNESLSATFDIKEKWGSVSTTLSGSHYFHDLSKYRLTLFSIINLRLFKGLSFFAFGGGSRIHDQLNLVKGESNLEEILLRRKELKTDYNYFFSIGLSFTFGSIYTNVVNPRFGSSGHGGMHVVIN
ncbi:MAG: hypothetical protein ACOC6P_03440 [Candidatus Aminicenantaceae bacterium]